MTVISDVQKLNPGDIIDLFVLDMDIYSGGILRFHSTLSSNVNGEVYWQGETYQPFPVTISGFEKSKGKELPRPTMQISNVLGLISTTLLEFDDLINCKVIRKSTFVKYLDKENFPGNVNPTADPQQYFPDEVWVINRKVSENKYYVEFELSSEWDLEDKQIPGRPCSATFCAWRYRGPDCGYSGGPVADENDKPVTTLAQDKCSRRYSGCVLRYGTSAGLPLGSFIGTGIIR